MLAALSTAKAEVREFYPSTAPIGVQFVYSPDQVALDSWLAMVLRKTGMDIWVLLMRDLLLMDSYDSAPAIPLEAGGATPIEKGEAPVPINIDASGGCGELPPSQQFSCELERDLLATGWSIPDLNAFSPSGIGAQVAGDPRIARGGTWLGEPQKFAFDAQSSEPAGTPGDVSPGPGLDQPTGEELVNPAYLAAPLAAPFTPPPTMIPASVPELPVSVMLLLGAGALSLAAAAKGFARRAVRGA